ncbi:MAG: hypothetical protein ACJ8AT_12450 [Hyalangium sp.]|uniref:hypothetical protein n=1 Tax=Hyalangium sp. TaxID=2028555 RepID=UPI00389991F9
MLLMRRQYTTSGRLCRGCLSKAFWHHTLRNLTLGWWGTISFFMTWYFLLSNLIVYARARSELGHASPSPSQAPRSAVATGDEALRILGPFEHNVRMLLRTGDEPAGIARDLARTHGVAPEEAQRFVEQIRAAG